jgi:hypothetical protein
VALEYDFGDDAPGGNRNRKKPQAASAAHTQKLFLRASAEALLPMNETGLMRRLCDDNREKSCLKSHLAVLFRKKFSALSKILSDPAHGTRTVGRPRLLTEVLIDILQEDSPTKVSDRFVSKNSNIMKDLDRNSSTFGFFTNCFLVII